MKESFKNQVSDYIEYISDCEYFDECKYFIDIAYNYLDNLSSNKKMIGIISNKFSELFVRACGAIPIYIPGGCECINNEVDELFPQISDSVTKAKISLLVDKSTPFYTNLKGMIVPIINDSDRKIPYYLEKKGYKVIRCEREPFIFNKATSNLRREQNEFLKKLMQMSNGIITKKRVIKSARVITKSYGLFKKIDESDIETKLKIFLKESYYLSVDIEKWQSEIEVFLDKIRTTVGNIKDNQNRKLMLIGCEIQFPNFKIGSILEECGISDYISRCCVPYPSDYSAINEKLPLFMILRQIHDIHYSNIDEISSFSGENIKFDKNISSVLFHLLKGQLPSAYYTNKVERNCISKGMPFLCIETDYTKADREQIKIRIEAFTELLNVRNKMGKRRKVDEKKLA